MNSTVGASGDWFSGLVGDLSTAAQAGVQTYNAVAGKPATGTPSATTATGTLGTITSSLGKNSIWILGGAAILVVLVFGFFVMRKAK
jgi:hypothetical protein